MVEHSAGDGSERLAGLRWWQEHSELDLLVEALLEALDGGDTAAARAAAEALEGGLDAHVREEERVYFPLVERLAPEHAGEIRHACRTHEELRLVVGSIRARLDRDDRPGAQRALEELLDLFRRHEHAEARLIADLGVLPASDTPDTPDTRD